ncbi:hypothetical protein G6F31_016373 [Rhizopus arrhizus]|nr:hypothetical protein G6F31_016373 [Rhizopus arrhizus]
MATRTSVQDRRKNDADGGGRQSDGDAEDGHDEQMGVPGAGQDGVDHQDAAQRGDGQQFRHPAALCCIRACQLRIHRIQLVPHRVQPDPGQDGAQGQQAEGRARAQVVDRQAGDQRPGKARSGKRQRHERKIAQPLRGLGMAQQILGGDLVQHEPDADTAGGNEKRGLGLRDKGQCGANRHQ